MRSMPAIAQWRPNLLPPSLLCRYCPDAGLLVRAKDLLGRANRMERSGQVPQPQPAGRIGSLPPHRHDLDCHRATVRRIGDRRPLHDRPTDRMSHQSPDRRCDWRVGANVWQEATSLWARGKRLRNRTINETGPSDETMCPMSGKARIRCPLP
jgi:hypothetical protein